MYIFDYNLIGENTLNLLFQYDIIFSKKISYITVSYRTGIWQSFFGVVKLLCLNK